MEINNKGEITYALDTCIEANRKTGILRISQEKYIKSVIHDFNLDNVEGKDTPAPSGELKEEDVPTTKEEIESASQLPVRSAIGKLWWAALISRPDIVCALHKCAAWQNKPSHKLFTYILLIIKYLKHTLKYAVTYRR